MALVLKTNENISDAAGVIPFLEKDAAIVRGVTLGLIDFSNPACLPAGYSSGSLLANGASLQGLTAGAAAAVVSSHNTPVIAGFDTGVTNGGLNGATSGSARIELPDANFALPVDGSVTRALIVLWAKIKNTGYLQNQGNPYVLIAGDSNSTPSSRGLFRVNLSAGGGLANAEWIILGAEAPSSALLPLVDGNLHQYAFEYIKSGSNVTVNLYVDKVQRGSRVTVNPSFGTPLANKQRLFSDGAYNSASGIHSGNKIYRYAVHDLSSRPDLTAADMLARDWDATIGYVS